MVIPCFAVIGCINALTARVPVAALEGLSRNPFVLSISMDAVVTAEQTSSGDLAFEEHLVSSQGITPAIAWVLP